MKRWIGDIEKGGLVCLIRGQIGAIGVAIETDLILVDDTHDTCAINVCSFKPKELVCFCDVMVMMAVNTFGMSWQ
jgi:hypothetical protein